MTQSDLLKPLVDAIETVKERIRDHRQELSGHEYRTRMSLIDPILRALGWEVSDPKLVGVEYETTSRGRPDYALNHHEINKGAVVEAKSLGSRLEEREVDQVTTYANRLGAPYAALTDGNRWVVYNMRDVSPLPERKVLDISLSEISPHAAALKLLLFWRLNVESGQPVEAETPIAYTLDGSDTDNGGKSRGLSEVNLIPLPDYKPKQHRIPRQMQFPGQDHPEDVEGYHEMWKRVAKWLYGGEGSSKHPPLPVRTKRNQKVVVDSTDEHMTKPFPIREGELYIENDANSEDCIRWAVLLLEEHEQDPSGVRILPRK